MELTEDQRKQNKEITGFETPEEYAAYELGYANGQDQDYEYIRSWNDNNNSKLGMLLTKKFAELQSQL